MKAVYSVTHISGEKWAVEKNAAVIETYYNEAAARARCAELMAKK